MTETPQQERDGLRTENLRDYAALRRSATDRKIAGVAGGLGRHLNIDPTILRVTFVVLCFFGGAGFVLYGVAWLLVPVDGSEQAVVRTSPSTRSALLIAAAVVASLLLLSNAFRHFWFPWPLAVIALVLFVILMKRDKPMNDHPTPPPPPPTGEGTTTTLPPYDETGPGPESPAPPWTPPTQQSYEPARPRPDRGPKLFGFTLALVAVALGSLGLYDSAGGHVVPAAAYAALALALVGAMLVVGAWFGRAGGLIALGLAAAIALGATSVSHGGFSDARRVGYSPDSAALVRDSYSQPTGQIVLDLRDVRNPAALDGRTITVSENVGEILVTLPPGVGADISAYVRGPGAVDLPGNHRGGIDTHVSQDVSAAGQKAHVNLNLDLSVGHIEVRQ
ncbi:MAG: PspC domain-containing protein [Nocardioidaceae bacterium]